MTNKHIQEQIQEHLDVIADVRSLDERINGVARAVIDCLQSGGKVLWMGNGGSAADSQHMAAEMVGRYLRNRTGLAAIALTTDTSTLTAVANDFGYESIFARQIEALCQPGDVAIGISTSGNSFNVNKALELAGRLGAVTVGFSGKNGGEMSQCVDHLLAVPSTVTARIQEAHILIGHILCDLVDARFAGDD